MNIQNIYKQVFDHLNYLEVNDSTIPLLINYEKKQLPSKNYEAWFNVYNIAKSKHLKQDALLNSKVLHYAFEINNIKLAETVMTYVNNEYLAPKVKNLEQLQVLKNINLQVHTINYDSLAQDVVIEHLPVASQGDSLESRRLF